MDDIDYITYVPKLDSELKVDHETGESYNQSMLLAKIVSELSNKPLIELFTKVKPLSMRGLSRDERYRRALEAYGINSSSCGIVYGKNIVIIDDVRTSGATGNTLARFAKTRCRVNKVYLVVAGRTYLTPEYTIV